MSDVDDLERAIGATFRRRVLAGVVLIGAVVAALWAMPVVHWLEISGVWINDHPVSGRLLFVLLFVTGTVLMIPGSILTMLGGYLFGFLGGVPLVSIGVALGAAAAALASRTIARDWLANRFRRDARFVAIDDAIADRALVLIVLSRLSLLIPFNFLNVIYGLTRIPLSTLTFGTWLGMIPAVVLYVYLGSAARNVGALLSGDLDTGRGGRALFVVGLGAVAAVTYIIHRIATSAFRRELGKNR